MYGCIPRPVSYYGARPCTRCGLPAPRKSSWPGDLCTSCTAATAEAVEYVRGGRRFLCVPWQGDFDEDDNPVDEHGQLVCPGPRSCQHRDCVAPEHVGKQARARSRVMVAA